MIEAVRVNHDGTLVVPPFECAWLTGESYELRLGSGCVQFEAKGETDITVIIRPTPGTKRWQPLQRVAGPSNQQGAPNQQQHGIAAAQIPAAGGGAGVAPAGPAPAALATPSSSSGLVGVVEPNYTVILGSHRNSCLKVEKNGSTVCQVQGVQGARVSSKEFTPFWIDYHQGMMTIGTGEPCVDNISQQWVDSDPIPALAHVGLSCWDRHVSYRNIHVQPSHKFKLLDRQLQSDAPDAGPSSTSLGPLSLFSQCTRVLVSHMGRDTVSVCRVAQVAEILLPNTRTLYKACLDFLARNFKLITCSSSSGSRSNSIDMATVPSLPSTHAVPLTVPGVPLRSQSAPVDTLPDAAATSRSATSTACGVVATGEASAMQSPPRDAVLPPGVAVGPTEAPAGASGAEGATAGASGAVRSGVQPSIDGLVQPAEQAGVARAVSGGEAGPARAPLSPTPRIAPDPEFVRLPASLLCDVLLQNTIAVSEKQIFDAVVRWAQGGGGVEQDAPAAATTPTPVHRAQSCQQTAVLADTGRDAAVPCKAHTCPQLTVLLPRVPDTQFCEQAAGYDDGAGEDGVVSPSTPPAITDAAGSTYPKHGPMRSPQPSAFSSSPAAYPHQAPALRADHQAWGALASVSPIPPHTRPNPALTTEDIHMCQDQQAVPMQSGSPQGQDSMDISQPLPGSSGTPEEDSGRWQAGEEGLQGEEGQVMEARSGMEVCTVLSLIRYTLMTPQELALVLQHPLVSCHPALLELVGEAMDLDGLQPASTQPGGTPGRASSTGLFAVENRRLLHCSSHDTSRASTTRFQRRLLPSSHECAYVCDGDQNGVMHYVGTLYGTQAWVNPVLARRIDIRASSPSGRHTDPKALAGDKFLRTNWAGPRYVNGQPDTWWLLDLGEAHTLILTYYTMRHDGSNDFVRSWALQGSSDCVTWTDLQRHTRDPAFKRPGQYMSWPVMGPAAQAPYRAFRLLLTGPTVSVHQPHIFPLSHLELYGFLHRVNMAPSQETE